MKKYKSWLILLNLLFLLGFVNFSIIKKEQTLSSGRLVLLELAPVEPRSLMQGDYMDLRYKIAAEAVSNGLIKQGYCVVKLESTGVATFIRTQTNTQVNAGEFLIKYKTPDGWMINIGAESFFFEEGQADKYSVAKYGGLRVDDAGNSVLVGMYDENLKKIE